MNEREFVNEGKESIMGLDLYRFKNISKSIRYIIDLNIETWKREFKEEYISNLKKKISEMKEHIGLVFCPYCVRPVSERILRVNTFVRVSKFIYHLYRFHNYEWKNWNYRQCYLEEKIEDEIDFLYLLVERPKRDKESIFSDDEFLEKFFSVDSVDFEREVEKCQKKS